MKITKKIFREKLESFLEWNKNLSYKLTKWDIFFMVVLAIILIATG